MANEFESEKENLIAAMLAVKYCSNILFLKCVKDTLNIRIVCSLVFEIKFAISTFKL